MSDTIPPVEASASSPVQAAAASASSPAEVSVVPPVAAADEACGDPVAASRGNSELKPRGRPFEPGRSGNPHGQPKGSRNLITRAVQELIDANAEELIAKAIEKGLNGDSAMQRVLLSRVIPAQRERMVELDLPSIVTAADAPAASAAVLAACSSGEISPAEAEAVMTLIRTHVQNIHASDLEARVAALESKEQK